MTTTAICKCFTISYYLLLRGFRTSGLTEYSYNIVFVVNRFTRCDSLGHADENNGKPFYCYYKPYCSVTEVPYVWSQKDVIKDVCSNSYKCFSMYFILVLTAHVQNKLEESLCSTGNTTVNSNFSNLWDIFSSIEFVMQNKSEEKLCSTAI